MNWGIASIHTKTHTEPFFSQCNLRKAATTYQLRPVLFVLFPCTSNNYLLYFGQVFQSMALNNSTHQLRVGNVDWSHANTFRLLCQLQHIKLSRLKLLFEGELFKVPRFQSALQASRGEWVQLESDSPWNQKTSSVLANTQSLWLRVGLPAGRASSHPVTLPVLTTVTF